MTKAVKTRFPRPVRVIENEWIPLSDGCRLAARIWLPEDVEDDPVPALLEYIPYRKGDNTAGPDATRHAYFAGHGYACVRVDMRGSGESDGVLLDEYSPLEQADAVEVIAWLAAQPWCTGAVGMFGISWGGFNALQVAAHRPPALKAIITVCSTDDRYADDIHYVGGCVLGAYMLSWGSTMLALNARPPDPAVVGERWRDMWLERLEGSPPFVETWLSHQRRDAYWKQGSVCEDYSAIECAVYAVGGWADTYTNAVLRLLAGLPGPRKGLIGPWAHGYPHEGVPGPAIGFLQECLRWWDHWLKGEDSGIMGEPVLRAWMQEPVEPRTFHAERPGRWVAEPSWPSAAIESRSVPLALEGSQVTGAQSTGLDCANFMGGGVAGDFPPDQRFEDGASLTWTSEPLSERLEILGFPEVFLTLAASQPSSLVAVRLCDVAVDGASLLVTLGLLNLTHRDSHEHPAPLEPGRSYDVTVRLNAIAHAFQPGHRIRVAVSPTYWPIAWPSPKAATLSVFGGRLDLPVRVERAEDGELAPFGEPESAPSLDSELLASRVTERKLRRDLVTGQIELEWSQDWGGGIHRLAATGLEFGTWGIDTLAIVEGDPLSARARSTWTSTYERGDWRTRVETESTMSADAEAFSVTNALSAYEGNTRIFAKTWHFSVPRDLV